MDNKKDQSKAVLKLRGLLKDVYIQKSSDIDIYVMGYEFEVLPFIEKLQKLRIDYSIKFGHCNTFVYVNARLINDFYL